jgi:hypothetical protein
MSAVDQARAMRGLLADMDQQRARLRDELAALDRLIVAGQQFCALIERSAPRCRRGVSLRLLRISAPCPYRAATPRRST